MDLDEYPITDGTGQGERMPRAFAAAYFDVDELSFESLLAMGAEFASRISYYNLANEEDGNWKDLFLADEAVIMAMILSVDLKRMEAEFRAIPYHRIEKIANYLLEIAGRIDVWLHRLSLSEHRASERIMRRLDTLIDEKLKAGLHDLGRIIEHAEIEPGVDLGGFSGTWKLDLGGEKPYPESTIDTLPPADEIKRRLGATYYTFANAIAGLQDAAKSQLQQSLQSQQHAPAIGLFMVFLRLFEKAQDRLNRFTLKHLDFYYRQVLKAANRGPDADSYYLLLQPAAGTPRVRIDSGTPFSAGKDAELNDIVYRADESILLGDTRVDALATLNLQQDPLISPEADLGFVARIKSARPSSDATAPDGEIPPTWPLFGAAQAGSGDIADAEMGFALASPLLLLQQGSRKVEIAFELESMHVGTLESRCDKLLEIKKRRDFEKGLGGFFALYLLRFDGGLSPSKKSRLVGQVRKLLPNRADEIEDLLQQDWQGLFYRLFKRPFRVQLSIADGWLEVDDAVLLPLDAGANRQQTGFRLTFGLDQAQPPIVPCQPAIHGEQLSAGLPVLRCLLNSQAHFCVFSVFQNLLVETLHVEVEVSGVKDLQVYNQNGQLDPGAPFQPFGPLPSASSYFVFGNYEMAQKPLSELTVDLEWADLPPGAGGFDEHYSAYATDMGNDRFEVAYSAFADGRWMPAESAAQTRARLFATAGPGNRVGRTTTIRVEQPKYARPIGPGIAAQDFGYGLRTRNGFHRLSLVSPENGFGHGEYTNLLTSVLSANARKKKPDPVPNPPYTPTLGGLTLAYRAATTIRPALDQDRAERLFHLHPFGAERVYPPRPEQRCFLLPQYEHEGNLFIGLRGRDIGGPLTLMFHLAQDRVDPVTARRANFEWFYLAANRWVPLPQKRILADRTHGFLASGSVTVDLPDDIDADNSVMPAGYYWLRLAVDRGAAAFSSCYLVKPNALKVSRDLEAANTAARPAAEYSWAPLAGLAGLGGVTRALPLFDGREPESDAAFRVRISERLRHKNRALLPRDYEQLVLEQFPDIDKVKCFNSLSRAAVAVKPGHVLVVVVPRAGEDDGETCQRKRVDARKLDQIREYLQRLSPPFVRLEVINPTYEQLQVRCRVRFADAYAEGVSLDRLNQQISDYLCPWKQPGYQARFGWKIRQREIEAYILSLDYIDFVTDFSMLHISVDQEDAERRDRYRLLDTASDENSHEAVVKPRYPWSLAIPMPHHYIENTRETKPIRAEVTGVGELEVGATFILGSSEHGEEK